MDQRVKGVIARLQISLARDLRADNIARQLGLSVSRLQHLSKNETGTTLVKYQKRLRIERACRPETTAERFFATVERNGLRKEPKPFSATIISIDATENVASTKLELDWHDVWLGGRNTSLLKPPPGAIETRYLSLIRFNDGWNIVSDISNLREGHNTTAS